MKVIRASGIKAPLAYRPIEEDHSSPETQGRWSLADYAVLRLLVLFLFLPFFFLHSTILLQRPR